MAIAFRAANGIGSGTTTTLGLALPTGNTATDALLAVYGGKPYTVDVSSGTFLTDYALLGNVTDGTTANALDGGSTRCHARWREHDGTESAPTGTLGASPSPRMNGMLCFSRSAGAGWLVAATTGSDGTITGTSFSATGAADPGYAAGDQIVVFATFPSDSSAPASVSITVPGCTLGTITERWATNVTTSGNDGGMYAYEATISSGTSSGAPSITATTGSGFSSGAVVFVRLREDPGALGGPLTTATETDTAQALGAKKAKAVGLVTETSTGQALGSRKSRTVGTPATTDTAQTVARRKTQALGTAADASTAGTTTRPSISAPAPLATETDTGRALGKRHTRALGTAIDVESASTIAGRHTKALGTAVDASTAPSVTRLKSRALTTAIETDTAQALMRGKRRALTAATETDTSQSLSSRKTRPVAAATEADTALTITRVGILGGPAGTATSASTALPLARSKAKPLTPAVEAETSRPITAAKRRTLTPATDTGTALPLARGKARTVGVAAGTHQALVLATRKAQLLGLAVELDLALAVTSPVVVGPPALSTVAVTAPGSRTRNSTPTTPAAHGYGTRTRVRPAAPSEVTIT